jgi:hypothetical protein
MRHRFEVQAGLQQQLKLGQVCIIVVLRQGRGVARHQHLSSSTLWVWHGQAHRQWLLMDA